MKFLRRINKYAATKESRVGDGVKQKPVVSTEILVILSFSKHEKLSMISWTNDKKPTPSVSSF
jgi:hypothetical protein